MWTWKTLISNFWSCLFSTFWTTPQPLRKKVVGRTWLLCPIMTQLTMSLSCWFKPWRISKRMTSCSSHMDQSYQTHIWYKSTVSHFPIILTIQFLWSCHIMTTQLFSMRNSVWKSRCARDSISHQRPSKGCLWHYTMANLMTTSKGSFDLISSSRFTWGITNFGREETQNTFKSRRLLALQLTPTMKSLWASSSLKTSSWGWAILSPRRCTSRKSLS